MRNVPAAVVRKFRLYWQVDPGRQRVVGDFGQAANSIVWLVRFYYLFVTFLIQKPLIFENWLQFVEKPVTDPLWPVGLLGLAGSGWFEHIAPILPGAGKFIGLFAVVFPGALIWRLGVFLYVFFWVAFINSYGSINHGQHLIVFIGFALLFLPVAVGGAGKLSRRDAMGCVMVFWFTQSILLLSYSMSGLYKVWASGFQLLTPDALVRILLNRMMSDTNPVPPALAFFVEHNYLTQFMHLGLIYVQVFAIFVLFRPHLHRPFGIALITFHFMTDLLMNIGFAEHIIIWGLFFIFSPFAPRPFSWFGMMQSLPILGIPFRLLAASRSPKESATRAWLVYDGECPFCKRYTHYLRVREAVGDLILVNAREGGAIVEEVKALPYDLNKGMVLKMNGRYYLGSDALHLLALLSSGGFFGTLNRWLFSLRGAAWISYPLLKLGRRAALILKGVSLIK